MFRESYGSPAFPKWCATLAESADIARSTAKEWLKVLVGLHIVYLFAPCSNNELKRLSKTPKLYFYDTGMELVKNYAYARSKVNITYFRDSNAKEIDVFVEENNVIHPLEIKNRNAVIESVAF